MLGVCEGSAPLGAIADPIDRHALIAEASYETLANHSIVLNQQNAHRTSLQALHTVCRTASRTDANEVCPVLSRSAS
jgi:hypothetical protein